MEYVLNLLGECRRCKRGLIAKKSWASIPRNVRKSIKKSFAGACGRGLCAGCYANATLNDTLLDYDRKTIPLDIFVEEYVAMKESGMTEQHIAEKLGMLKRSARWPADRLSTFRKALHRAKEAGLL